MISKLATINSTDHTVISPVVNKIIADINSKIIRDSTAGLQIESMYEEENITFKDDKYDNAIGGSNIDVSIEVITDEVLDIQTSRYKPINKSILRDIETGLILRPLYNPSEITFTFKYRVQSKSRAMSVKKRLQTYYATSGYQLIQDLPYSYVFPSNIISLLTNVAILEGFGTVNDYIESNALYKIDFINSRDGDIRIPTFRGRFVNTVGNFIDNPNELTIEKDGSEYIISFKFVTNIEMPLALYIQYPILVRNKPLDSIWLPEESVVKPVLNSRNELDISNIYNNLIPTGTKQVTDILYKVPSYDNFVPMTHDNSMYNIRLISLLLQVNPDDLTKVVSINDLSNVFIPQEIIDYFNTATSEMLFTVGGSIFDIELYEFSNIRDLGLYIDEDKVIRTTVPMDLTKTYHLLINFVTDFNRINIIDDESLARDIEMCEAYNLPYKLPTGKSMGYVSKATPED